MWRLAPLALLSLAARAQPVLFAVAAPCAVSDAAQVWRVAFVARGGGSGADAATATLALASDARATLALRDCDAFDGAQLLVGGGGCAALAAAPDAGGNATQPAELELGGARGWCAGVVGGPGVGAWPCAAPGARAAAGRAWAARDAGGGRVRLELADGAPPRARRCLAAREWAAGE